MEYGFEDNNFEEMSIDNEINYEEILIDSIYDLIDYCTFYKLPLLNKDFEIIKNNFLSFSPNFERKDVETN